MLLPCLIYLIIVVIIAVIVMYILESVMAPFWTLPPPVYMLIRLLIGLLVLLYFLNCIGWGAGLSGMGIFPRGR